MAGIVPQTTLEQIRTASDIVEIIGGYFPLKRAGANFVALCPFHKEKTPSFHVNPQRQIFHCFGCHKGGDVFTFLRDYENLTFMEAVQRLAERARIPLAFSEAGGQRQAPQVKEVLLRMHEQIAQRWHSALLNEAAGQIARDYLAKRGVPAEAVQLFRLGFAPELWDDTVNWAKSKGYDLSVVEQAGLVLRGEGSDRYYDRFRGRLMFPIGDEQGRVIGFSGRVLAGDEKTAKYVNSPETPIFHKSRVFYGLDKSKRAILEAGTAVVCEGQLDFIACFMAGVKNAVAPQGTAFTPDHARILKRYASEVILCLDADEAGQNAAVRMLDNLLGVDLAIRVAAIPVPHDPDSYIKAQGGPAFQKLIAQAEGFFDFFLGRLCATNDVATDRGRLAVLREMGLALSKARNSVLLETYAQKTALRLGVSPPSVLAEFRKLPVQRLAGSEGEKRQSGASATESKRPPQAEFRLLQVCMTSEEMGAWLTERLDLNWLQNETVRRILALATAVRRSGNWQGLNAFLTEIEESELRNLITEALASPCPQLAPERECQETLLQLRNRHYERRQAELLQQLNRPGLSEEESIAALKQHDELRRLKQQPLE